MKCLGQWIQERQVSKDLALLGGMVVGNQVKLTMYRGQGNQGQGLALQASEVNEVAKKSCHVHTPC